MVQARLSAPRPLRSTMPATRDADRPAGQDQVDEEHREREAEAAEIEAEERDRQQRHRHHADREPDDAHDHQRGDELDRPQRAHHQVAHVARPHLLQERDREAELAAEQDVPQQHRADEGAAGLREEAGILRRRRAAGSPTSASAPPASRSVRAGAARTSAADTNSAAPSRTMRRGENATCARRLHAHCAASRGLAAAARDVEEHLFEIAAAVAREQARRRVVVLDAAALHHDDAVAQPLDLAHVVRGEQDGGAALAAIALEPAAHPVGGVGIERGGRLVEQQNLGLVDQRLGERDAGLLAGRQLAGRPVEELAEVEFVRQLADAAGDVVARRRACRTPSGSAAPSAASACST